jgi:hypothetical protein
MKSLVTVSRDTSSLLTLDEAKKFLRVEGNEEDALITAIMDGAFAYAEGYLNKTVGANSYRMSQDTFEDVIKLFRPPVSEITKIEYIDTGNAIQELDLTLIVFDPDSGYLFLKAGQEWPDLANQPFAVHVEYDCDGMYAEKDGNDILDAIKLTMTYRYDWRDDPNQRWRKASDNILSPHRIRPFG